LLALNAYLNAILELFALLNSWQTSERTDRLLQAYHFYPKPINVLIAASGYFVLLSVFLQKFVLVSLAVFILENCALLGCYAERGVNVLRAFPDNLSVPSSRLMFKGQNLESWR
jgi:hypothetical protein